MYLNREKKEEEKERQRPHTNTTCDSLRTEVQCLSTTQAMCKKILTGFSVCKKKEYNKRRERERGAKAAGTRKRLVTPALFPVFPYL